MQQAQQQKNPNSRKRLQIWAIVIIICLFGVIYMLSMPGKSYRGPLPPLSNEHKDIRRNLLAHVTSLAATIGPRSVRYYQNLKRAEQYIQSEFTKLGYKPINQTLMVNALEVNNISVEIPGANQPDSVIIIGAHYDTALDTPGADDNASGIAALLELARFFRENKPNRTVRLVAFVNEESPFFMTNKMGSYQYAKQVVAEKINIEGMISLESIGYYSQEKNSQHYPWLLHLFYPNQANFIGFVSDLKSRNLLANVIGAFRQTTKFPSEGLAGLSAIPGVSWSDQWSFWEFGIPAIMITDTTLYRSPYYHQTTDQPHTLDYDSMARVVLGLMQVFEKL